MKVLLTEDDPMLGESIKQQLTLDGFNVDWVQDGVSSEHAALCFKYSVIIMDINLPRKNGLEVIISLRKKQCYTPILILTANDEMEDCIEGLANGADDYLAKPFEYALMRERLRALVRRDRNNFAKQFKHRDLVMDCDSRTLTYKAIPYHLARREYDLLETLLSSPNKVFRKQELLDSLYNWDDEISSNVLEAHIYNLRKYFGKDYIRTVRGIGYQIN